MPEPIESQKPPEIHPDTPPQLRLLLGQLGQALARDQASSSQTYLWAALEQLIRFYAGLALEALEQETAMQPSQFDALCRHTYEIQGCTQVLVSCVSTLKNPQTRRGQQLQEVFFAYDAPLFTRWLGLAEPALELPALSEWRPGGTHPAPVRAFMPILRAWLQASQRLFEEERFTLDREVELTMMGQVRPPVVIASGTGELTEPPEVPFERTPPPNVLDKTVVAEPAPPGEAQHILQQAHESLARNLFEIAEQGYNRVLSLGDEPAALFGRGRARSCMGRYAEAEADLAAAQDAQALFYRAANRRQSGQLDAALEDCMVALERTLDLPLRAALEMERGAILSLMKMPAAMGAYKCAVDMYQEIANREKSTRAEIELACSLVEKAFLADPTLKEYRAKSDRSNAISLFKKLKKREPLFSMDIELLRYVMERREPWGRPDNDLLIVERDIRSVRVLLELLPRSDEMVLLQKRFLDLAEERLKVAPLPETFTNQLFGLFSDLASSAGRNEDRRWQTEHWLNLAELFGNHELKMRCLVLACSSLQHATRQEDAALLVSILNQLGDELPLGLPSGGLDLLGSAFNTVRAHLARWKDESFKTAVQNMADRWRALPATLPGRAGVGRQVLNELAGRKVSNVVEVD